MTAENNVHFRHIPITCFVSYFRGMIGCGRLRSLQAGVLGLFQNLDTL